MSVKISRRLVGKIGVGTYRRVIGTTNPTNFASCIPHDAENQLEMQRNATVPSSGVINQQMRFHGWAPPAYVKQKDERRKTRKKSWRSRKSKSRKPSARDRKNQQRDGGTEKPPEKNQGAPYHRGQFNRRKIFRLQSNFLDLLESYTAAVTAVEDESSKVVESDTEAASAVRADEDQMGDSTSSSSFDAVDDDELWDQAKQVLAKLNDLEAAHANGSLNNTGDAIRSTEQTYKEICQSMHRLISTWSKRDVFTPMADMNELNNQDTNDSGDAVVYVGLDKEQPSPPPPASYDVAEEFLWRLVKIQEARKQFLSLVQEPEVRKVTEQEAHKPTWKEWFTNTFIFSKGEDEPTEKDMDERIESYDEKTTSEPDKSVSLTGTTITPALLCRVLRAIIKGSNVQYGDGTICFDDIDQNHFGWRICFSDKSQECQEISARQKELADRLSNLVDACTTHGGLEMDLQVLEILVKEHAKVGLISSVARAETLCRLYHTKRKEQQDIKRPSLFNTVLKGYRLASSLEPSQSQRVNAAKNAEWLLRKRQLRAVKGSGALKGQSSQPKATNFAIGSYKLVLQTLANPGIRFLPDMSERAEKLVELLMGKEEFRQLIGEDDLSRSEQVSPLPIDAGILHYLLVIYMNSLERDKMKRLLKLMESSRHTNNGATESETESSSVFPNCLTYNTVLSGVARTPRREKEDRSTLMENALYGTSLLESIEQAGRNTPDEHTYYFVLRLWAKTKSSQAGYHALSLLSRMEVSSAASGYSWTIGARAYSMALKCLMYGASGRQLGAAHRAAQLLHKMHAQSRPLTSSNQPSTYIGDESATPTPASQVKGGLRYNDSLSFTSPDVYNCVIDTCKNTNHPSDIDEAFRIAFDTYNLMLERGVVPSAGTYLALLRCCKKFLSHDEERRNDLARIIFQAACDQGKATRGVLSQLRSVDKKLYAELQNFKSVSASSSSQDCFESTTNNEDSADEDEKDEDLLG